jgi:hypothetical protein
MRVVVGGLLALATLSAIASCRLDTGGLSSHDGGLAGIQIPGTDAQADTSVAGASAGGASGTASGGQGGFDLVSAAGTNGEAGGGAAGTGEAGISGGEAGASAGTTGAAGDGAAGDGAAGTGAAGTGAAGTGAAGTGVAVSPIGCADGTREGFLDQAKYPAIAACSGAWQIPGLVGPNTQTPQCQRRGGNTGNSSTTGAGCSVADLCAEGWHVCESVAEFKTKAPDCIDVLMVIGGSPTFFATRQRGAGVGGDLMCDAQNREGTNNVYGCGNIGSQAAKGCMPFTRMLRDADCKNNPPWMCTNGPTDQNILELDGVTKPATARGGVLCCAGGPAPPRAP